MRRGTGTRGPSPSNAVDGVLRLQRWKGRLRHGDPHAGRPGPAGLRPKVVRFLAGVCLQGEGEHYGKLGIVGGEGKRDT